MASPAEVAAYRVAGHTVAETCLRFGIKERAVYKACAAARAAQRPPMVSPTKPPAVPHENMTGGERPEQIDTTGAIPSPEDKPTHRQLSRTYAQYVAHKPSGAQGSGTDDTAGDDTDWVCPYTGEVFPIIPGTSKRMWLAQRRAAVVMQYQRKKALHNEGSAPAAVTSSAPVPSAPVPVQTEEGSQSAPVLPHHMQPALSSRTSALPYQPVRYFAPRQQTNPYPLVYIREHLPPPNILLAVVVALVLMLLCSV